MGAKTVVSVLLIAVLCGCSAVRKTKQVYHQTVSTAKTAAKVAAVAAVLP